MRFTFEHQVQFRDGSNTLPFRSTSWWKTERGALNAAERHAAGMDRFYVKGMVAQHALTIKDDQNRFVTNMAA